MTNKQKYAKLKQARTLLDRLAKIDLDDLLSLIEGANSEVVALHMRVTSRIQFLEQSDPDCAALADMLEK